MSSQALADLLVGIQEVAALRQYAPRAANLSHTAHSVGQAQLAHRRACVVLLCSHYERYLYGLNEAIVDHLNASGLPAQRIPLGIRLLQSRSAVDKLALQQWDNRADALRAFAAQHGPIWSDTATVSTLEPAPNLEWMKSPKVPDVIRYFKSLGITNVFASITRTADGRRRLTRALQALVDARNGIAHGDQTVQPVRTEITEFSTAVSNFGERTDRLMARQMASLTGQPAPW